MTIESCPHNAGRMGMCSECRGEYSIPTSSARSLDIEQAAKLLEKHGLQLLADTVRRYK